MNDRSPPPPPAEPRAPHWPALDGLRGLAVMAVVLYHLGHLSGGFLGVDLFFVLSGFLITTLLLREQARDSRISLRRFWARRARRLLPALGVTLVTVVVVGRLLLDADQLLSLRRAALSAALYVANWHFALAPEAGYFAGAPSPLRHTWSLAIEEQLYLVWPVVVVAIAAAARRLGVRVAFLVGIVAGVTAVASTAWMAAHVGVWSTDRLYLGTDTRLAAPMLGALLACTLRLRGGRARDRGIASTAGSTTLLGVGLVGLAVATVAADGAAEWMYRGGFLLAALLGTAAVAGGALTTWAPALTVLGTGPLRWLGLRSYGIYLFSWPIQIFAVEQGLSGAPLTVLTIGAALLLAAASYRWFEMPIRERRFLRLPEGRPRITAAVGATVVVFAVIIAGTATSAEPDPLAAKDQEEFEAEATRPAAEPTGPVGDDARVLIVGDSVGYTLGLDVPDDLVGIAAVESRALPGCGLLTSGTRPADAIAAGAPETYDGCAEPVAEADRLGLEGRPDVVLLVTGAWETSVHERDGREVGPGDEAWARQLRDQLAVRVRTLSSTGAVVALWADPCAPTQQERDAQSWYVDEVLVPVARDDANAEVVRPATVTCEDGEPIEVPEVGDPRPEDGQHWSTEGSAWLWRTWGAPTMRLLHLDALQRGGVSTMLAGDSVAFTLDYYGADGAERAGFRLVKGPTAVGCGLVREGTAANGDRDLAETCGGITETEDLDLARSEPELVLVSWGAWEMAGVRELEAAGTGVPGDPAYDAMVRMLLAERLQALSSTGATVALLGVDCWPPISEFRATERVQWWRDLSREVTDEVGVTYLDPTDALCVDGEQRDDIPGVGDPRPTDGAHWTTAGGEWFWEEWLGPHLRSLLDGA